jgi:cytochrome P450
MQTTANTLCFTFALLALHPEVQEQLFEHIRSVVVPGTRPVSSIKSQSQNFFNDVKGIRSSAATQLCDSVSEQTIPLSI